MADSSPWGLVAGAIPVVGGIVSGLINSSNVDSQNAANRAFQQQQQQDQNAYNLQMWNMQNAYNAPSAVMARYSAAGLNPNLIYGSATGNVASPPQPAARVEYVQSPKAVPDFGALSAAGLAAYNNFKLTANEVSKTPFTIGNIQADTDLKVANTLGANASTAVVNAGLPFTADKIRSEINASDAAARDSDVDANVKSMLAPYQADLAVANTQKTIQESLATLHSDERAQAMQSTNLATGLQTLVNMRTANMKDNSEIDQINQAVTNLVRTGTLQQMDIQLRNHGVMPGQNAYSAILAKLLQGITGLNVANGTNDN